MTDTNTHEDHHKKRLGRLRSFDILDTPPETEFNLMVQLVAGIFDASLALISFFDGKRVYVKAGLGFPSNTNIQSKNSLFEISDTALEIENLENFSSEKHKEFAVENRKVIYYCSEPLTTSDGHVIGNICVVKFEPYKATHKQLSQLSNLAKLCLEKLNNRKLVRQYLRSSDERIHMLIHDLKNPMTTLSLQTELAGRFAQDYERVVNLSGKMNGQVKSVVNSLNAFLRTSISENGVVKMLKIKVDLLNIFQQLQSIYGDHLPKNSRKLSISLTETIFIYGDEAHLLNAFMQLIEHAVKFPEMGDEIIVDIERLENKVIVAIRDVCKNINKQELPNLFTKFSALSTISSGNYTSNGLELSLAKILIELHKGRLWAESEDERLTFYVELPVK